MDIRQSSFAGGEWAPEMYGRIDLSKHSIAIRKGRNVIVTRHGLLYNRPGTVIAEETKDSAVRSRLIPFKFSNGQNFAMEFGDHYIRFYQNGGQVLTTGAAAYAGGTTYRKDQYVTSAAVVYRSLQANNIGHTPAASPTWWAPATIFEIETPYAAADLRMIKYAQEGDVVTLTCRGYDQMELRRYSNLDWSLDAPSLTSPSAPAVGAAYRMGIEYDISKVVTGPTSIYEYVYTLLVRDQFGRLYETLAAPVYSGSPANDTVISDGTEPVWSGATTYGLNNVVQDVDTSVPAAVPYVLWISLQAGNTGNTPRTSPTWWKRLAIGSIETIATLASTWGRPGGGGAAQAGVLGRLFSLSEHKPIVWVAVSNDPLTGFGVPSGYVAEAVKFYRGNSGVYGLIAVTDVAHASVLDDNLEADFTQRPPQAFTEFVTDKPETVAFYEQRRVFGRRGSIFMSKTGDYYRMDRPQYVLDDSPIQLNLAAQKYEEIRWLAPLRTLMAGTSEASPWTIGGAQGAPITPVTRSARPQNAYGSSWLDPLVIGNTVLHVQDMGNLVREMIFEQNSDSYDSNDLSVLAAHLFSGTEIVEWAYAQVPFSVAWSVRDDGKMLTLTYDRKNEIAAWTWHDTGFGEDAFESACTIQEGEEHAIYVIAARTINGATKRYVERFATRNVPRLEDGTIDVARGVFLDSSITYEGAPATVVTGLDHLEGRMVGVLADGAVLAERVVGGGSIDISDEAPDGASIITVGLTYWSDIEPMAVAFDKIETKSKIKRVVNVTVEVIDSIGVWAGQTYDKLKEWRQRTVADGYAALKTFSGVARISLPGTYTPDGRLCLRHKDPTPFGLLGITREVDLE